MIVVPLEIREPGITSRAVQQEERPGIGLTVSVGQNIEGITEGDVVFFGQYSHTQVTHDGVSYLIMRAEDVYLVA